MLQKFHASIHQPSCLELCEQYKWLYILGTGATQETDSFKTTGSEGTYRKPSKNSNTTPSVWDKNRVHTYVSACKTQQTVKKIPIILKAIIYRRPFSYWVFPFQFLLKRRKVRFGVSRQQSLWVVKLRPKSFYSRLHGAVPGRGVLVTTSEL